MGGHGACFQPAASAIRPPFANKTLTCKAEAPTPNGQLLG